MAFSPQIDLSILLDQILIKGGKVTILTAK